MKYCVELFIDKKFVGGCSYGKDLIAACNHFQDYKFIDPHAKLKLIGRDEHIIMEKEYNEDIQNNQTD